MRSLCLAGGIAGVVWLVLWLVHAAPAPAFVELELAAPPSSTNVTTVPKSRPTRDRASDPDAPPIDA